MRFPTMWYVRSLIRTLSILLVKLLTKHHLEFLRLKGGCTGSSESTLVKMPHCWKSHVMAHILYWWEGGLEGNFGTGVRTSFLKPTPIIYLIFEKNDLFIYLIEQNVYIFIYCVLIFIYPLCCL